MNGAVAAFFSILRTTWAARIAYRADFVISAVMVLFGELLIPMVTYFIYRGGGAFPGWTFEEALLIQAVFTLAKGVAFPLFFGIVGSTLNHVREGTFDLFLIKPRSILYMTVVTSFQTDGIGRLVGGAGLFLFAVSRQPSLPAFSQWLGFSLLFICSLLALFAYALIMSGIVFQWVGSSRVFEIFDAVTSFGMYPRSIFNRAFQTIMTMIMPIGIIAFYPASALLGKSLAGVSAAVPVSLAFFGLSLWFWHWMLKKYTSAGG